MAPRTLQKWHSAENDFLVDVQESGASRWWTPERVRAVCHRTSGVGADGLLVASVGADVVMELYNADGSVAEMSGNGIRCLAGAVRRSSDATWNSLTVETLAGARTVDLSMNGSSGYASVSMGKVTLGPPLEGAWGVAFVGNPHVVVLDDDSWSVRACEDIAESLSARVGGANVEFLSVVAHDYLRIRVFERGVGWTRACGTGSCAVAVVAREHAASGDEVRVDNPGGELRVTLDGFNATLSGPMRFVANVEWAVA